VAELGEQGAAISVLILCRVVSNTVWHNMNNILLFYRAVSYQKLKMTGTARLRHDVPNRAMYNRVRA
jgi:hypothetical protein